MVPPYPPPSAHRLLDPAQPPEVHRLLEPASVQYTSSAVQRAFVSWTQLGHANQFYRVADYYHHLEALELTMTPEQRALSRSYEYSLLSAQPPMSEYLLKNFPNLYPSSRADQPIPEEIRKMTEDRTFNINANNRNTSPTTEPSNEDIVATSQIIRNYCISHHTSLRQFMCEFRMYATKLGINPTVSNVAFYIKYRNVLAQREMEAKPKNDLRFKTPSPVEKKVNGMEFSNNSNGYVKVENEFNANKKKQETQKNKVVDQIVRSIFENARLKNTVNGVVKTNERKRLLSESEINDVLKEISAMKEKLNEEVYGQIGTNDDNNNTVIVKTEDLIDDYIGKDIVIEAPTENVCLIQFSSDEMDSSTKTLDKANESNKTSCSFKIIKVKSKRFTKKRDSLRKRDLKNKLENYAKSIENGSSFRTNSTESVDNVDFESCFENSSDLSEDFEKLNLNRCSSSIQLS
ncbi:unnamed protein product [Plutella xylostella]|uniref:(diamondback moth) hypothetical protein n=1 Tax=Plutella xylostella TaxID=51655 RepID=A0A8S4G4M0_PLUXY|nr:unnamed protein product [Plutella xylostella]